MPIGERLDLIATHFDTLIETVPFINCFAFTALADCRVLLGRTRAVVLPQFEAYQVSVAGVNGFF